MGEKYIYFPKSYNLYCIQLILVYLFVNANKIKHVFKSNNIITLLCTELVIKYNKLNLEGDANPFKLLLHILINDVSCSNIRCHVFLNMVYVWETCFVRRKSKAVCRSQDTSLDQPRDTNLCFRAANITLRPWHTNKAVNCFTGFTMIQLSALWLSIRQPKILSELTNSSVYNITRFF